MTEHTASGLRREYLGRLDDAMRDLPHGVAVDIRAAIVEELEGLDEAATAERISAFGDPAEIARRAREESGAPSAPPLVAAPRGPVTTTKGFAILSALTLGFGGFLVPVIGWVVGVALVTSSTLWKRSEKAVAILAPLVVAGLSLLIVTVMTGFGVGVDDGGSSGSGDGLVVNPLLPSIAGWHFLVILGFLLVPASGLWLLWRLRGRTAGS